MERLDLAKVDSSTPWKAKAIMVATKVKVGVLAGAGMSVEAEAKARASAQMAEVLHLLAHAMSLGAAVARGQAQHLPTAREAVVFRRIGLTKMAIANHDSALVVEASHQTEWIRHPHRMSVKICIYRMQNVNKVTV